MTLNDLISLLEDYRETFNGNTEVRLMTQHKWPFECSIEGVCSGREINEDPEGNDDDQDVGHDSTIYIVEGSQLCYGSKRAWEVI